MKESFCMTCLVLHLVTSQHQDYLRQFRSSPPPHLGFYQDSNLCSLRATSASPFCPSITSITCGHSLWDIQVLKNHDLLLFQYIDMLLLSSSSVTRNYHEVCERLSVLPFSNMTNCSCSNHWHECGRIFYVGKMKEIARKARCEVKHQQHKERWWEGIISIFFLCLHQNSWKLSLFWNCVRLVKDE